MYTRQVHLYIVSLFVLGNRYQSVMCINYDSPAMYDVHVCVCVAIAIQFCLCSW